MEADYYSRMADIQTRHWWYEGRRQILASVISRLDLPASARVLEAGCGTGANIAILQQFGAVEAFEPFEFARNYAADLTGLNIKDGALPAPIPFDQSFDLVCAFDVIEHIDDDTGSVKALCDITKDNGHAVFTVPAYQFMWSNHDEINHHKRRYTKPQLEQVLRDAGYEVEFISYYNMFLFPLAVAVRLGKKLFGLADKPDEEMPRSEFVNQTLLEMFTWEKTLLKHISLPFGLSLIAVCRKSVDAR